MKTYILCWDASTSNFGVNDYQTIFERLKANKSLGKEMSWPVGEATNIVKGDEFLFLQMGIGIIMRGTFSSLPYLIDDVLCADLHISHMTDFTHGPHLEIPYLKEFVSKVDWKNLTNGTLLDRVQKIKFGDLWSAFKFFKANELVSNKYLYEETNIPDETLSLEKAAREFAYKRVRKPEVNPENVEACIKDFKAGADWAKSKGRMFFWTGIHSIGNQLFIVYPEYLKTISDDEKEREQYISKYDPYMSFVTGSEWFCKKKYYTNNVGFDSSPITKSDRVAAYLHLVDKLYITLSRIHGANPIVSLKTLIDKLEQQAVDQYNFVDIEDYPSYEEVYESFLERVELEGEYELDFSVPNDEDRACLKPFYRRYKHKA